MRVAYPRSNRYTSPLIEMVPREGIEPSTDPYQGTVLPLELQGLIS